MLTDGDLIVSLHTRPF